MQECILEGALVSGLLSLNALSLTCNLVTTDVY